MSGAGSGESYRKRYARKDQGKAGVNDVRRASRQVEDTGAGRSDELLSQDRVGREARRTWEPRQDLDGERCISRSTRRGLPGTR